MYKYIVFFQGEGGRLVSTIVLGDSIADALEATFHLKPVSIVRTDKKRIVKNKLGTE